MSMPATPTSLVYLRGATSEVEELRPLSDLAEIVSYTPLVATTAGSAASPDLAGSSMPVASNDTFEVCGYVLRPARLGDVRVGCRYMTTDDGCESITILRDTGNSEESY